jgi:hypothetical protein
MRLNVKIFLGLHLIFILLQHPIKAQKNIHNSIENIDSLENIINYEQRVDRNPYRVWYQLNKSNTKEIDLAPKFQGITLAAYSIKNGKVYVNNKVKPAVKNSFWIFPFYKADLQILPDVRALYGYTTNPVRLKLGSILQTTIPLFKGLTVTGGIYLPIKNELDNQPLRIRPSPIYINQFAKIGEANFLSITAGTFYNDSYGINFQYQYQNFKSLLSYGFEASVSGKYYYYPEVFKYTVPNQFLFLANTSYRFRKKDISLKLSGGQFLYSDRGIKVEMINQFRLADVSFYGLATKNGATLGVRLSFRIWPGPILETSKFRLRTTDDFTYNYIYTAGYKIGENYRLRYNLDEKLRQYHQGFWNNALKREN